MDEELFQIAGIRTPQEQAPVEKIKWREKRPCVSMVLLGVILAGCFGSGWFLSKDPGFMDLGNCTVPPGRAFWFGTDTMGRDIFAMIWHGGRVSLLIGAAATLISVAAAVLIGSAGGFLPRRLDHVLMRFTEILLSIPGLLLVILLQAALKGAGIWGISAAIGLTGWPEMAKVVRTEVLQIKSSEYVAAAKCMGGGFFYILRRHLAPNFISSLMFMAVMHIRSAIAVESALSFMGIGLPLDVISWGSMLSLSERALLGGAWWMILIPGIFLVLTLSCVTNIGNYLRKHASRGQSNL